MKPWTFADAVRAAKERGWVLSRVSGGHYVFTKASAPRHLPIPFHRGNLPAGTQRAIMRQLRIRPHEL